MFDNFERDTKHTRKLEREWEMKSETIKQGGWSVENNKRLKNLQLAELKSNDDYPKLNPLTSGVHKKVMHI